MPTPQEYIQQLGRIVGDRVSEGVLDLDLNWNSHPEAKALLMRIRTIQKQLRLLKKDLSTTMSAIKSQFTTARTNVGTGLGPGIAAGLFGRRAAGRMTSAARADLRRAQLKAVEPYERVKRLINQTLDQLDNCKAHIELSPEYQLRAPQTPPPEPPLLADAAATPRYYAYIAKELKGPYTVEQLQALHDASAITDGTQCCPEGTGEWHPYSQIAVRPCS